MIEQQQSVNLEQAGILAKLLAKENLRVQHGNYATAFFDVQHRVLGLPLWQNKGKHVYDLLCGHEVGHALFTPVDGHKRFNEACPGVPFSICNIVEDIRIERMVQDTYPGLSVSFHSAYAQFVADDFFQIKGKDISKLNVADRLNIHAKTRGAVQVPLSTDELAIYDKALAAQTFDDVLAVCKQLAELVGKQPQQSVKPAAEPTDESNGGDDAGTTGQSGDQAQDDTQSDQNLESTDEPADDSGDEAETNRTTSAPQASVGSEVDGNNNSTAGQSAEQIYGDLASELTSQTEQALSQAIQNMTVNDGNHYFSMPSEATIRQTVVPFSEVMAQRAKRPNYAAFMADAGVQAKVAKLRANAKKYVATLSNEFNMRKAAHQYSRATVASTGIINVNRLHSYKYADDIFKSITRLADVKNHGMVFFVDYSSSMSLVLGTVLEHTVNLVMFCRSLNIPFQVYGFTNPPEGHKKEVFATQAHSEIRMDNLQLVEIFSSRMSKAQFELAVSETLAHVAFRSGTRTAHVPNINDYHCPVTGKCEALNGTPLLEAIVAAHVLVRQFRQANPVQKVNVLFLTDGDGSGLNYVHSDAAYAKLGQKSSIWGSPTSNFVGVINGRKIELTYGFDRNYEKLIASLRQTCDCTATCFFVPNSEQHGMRKVSYALAILKCNAGGEVPEMPDNLKKAYRKDKCLEITGGHGFNAYYVLGAPADLVIEDEESFDPEFDADAKVTTSKMAKAFTEFNSDKRTSRILLNKFSKIIA